MSKATTHDSTAPVPGRTGLIYETTDDQILIRLPEWMTPAQVEAFKEGADAWFDSAVRAAFERQEEGR